MTILHEAPSRSAGDERDSRRSRRTRIESERATRSRAAQRALDRRHRRSAAGRATPPRRTGGGLSMTGVSLRERLQHTPFVVPVIALLVLGLGLSLWLSTKAAQDSYKLGIERTQNQSLIDQRDALKRTYESGNSAPELSDKAARLGMIPADNPARMIVDDPRRPRVVGKPEPASGRPMGSLNPDTAPDPAESIDPSEVDDSIGLGGGSGSAGPEAGGTSTPQPAPSQPASDEPAAGGPSPSQTAPPGANPLPSGASPAPSGAGAVPPAAPSTPTPAPNVVPTP
ncbi:MULTISPECIES: hypothetical protein [Gordonia]|uniref:Cell division protein FtsL n=1 Tax=Gordonia hongkongensis TaxID=1701090 RepID=A0ABT6BUX6_9ACTN|nr:MULTISPECIES: hypothetical protein [Gordonia]OCW87020.1 hypothetical protein A8M60_18780 [Nocardia farcinica]MBN0971597.1 hypothetical protein [Gordonia sp. BP-119]MBN0981269.1 hypothetical protein [Gordonia sp. BP-94]MDF6101867.1 hypothetical protein [Gordonia hongkongensis]WGJ84111.1 hypothetical protein QAD21_15045 [Gordonia sp. SMJS1]